MSNRRAFIKLVGGAAVWPTIAYGQLPRTPVIGILHSGAPSQFIDGAFRQGLQEAGFVEGQNLIVEPRFARGAYERLPALAEELVRLRVNVLAVFGTPAVRIAKSASLKSAPPIPVVFAMGSDPVAEGLVEGLNRPGGHMTGITSIAGALTPKRLELMREFLREDAAIAILINPDNPLSERERGDAEAASRAIGQRLEVLTASNPVEIDKAFAYAQAAQAQHPHHCG